MDSDELDRLQIVEAQHRRLMLDIEKSLIEAGHVFQCESKTYKPDVIISSMRRTLQQALFGVDGWRDAAERYIQIAELYLQERRDMQLKGGVR